MILKTHQPDEDETSTDSENAENDFQDFNICGSCNSGKKGKVDEVIVVDDIVEKGDAEGRWRNHLHQDTKSTDNSHYW